MRAGVGGHFGGKVRYWYTLPLSRLNTNAIQESLVAELGITQNKKPAYCWLKKKWTGSESKLLLPVRLSVASLGQGRQGG
jgi:hypothetical protein